MLYLLDRPQNATIGEGFARANSAAVHRPFTCAALALARINAWVRPSGKLLAGNFRAARASVWGLERARQVASKPASEGRSP